MVRGIAMMGSGIEDSAMVKAGRCMVGGPVMVLEEMCMRDAGSMA